MDDALTCISQRGGGSVAHKPEIAIGHTVCDLLPVQPTRNRRDCILPANGSLYPLNEDNLGRPSSAPAHPRSISLCNRVHQ